MAANVRDSRYDDVLFGILKEEGNIVSFFDIIFGFLYKRTDFYANIETTGGKLGFAPGEAENVVIKTFRKYEKRVRLEDKRKLQKNLTSVEQQLKDTSLDVPNVASEIEVATTSNVKKDPREIETNVKTHGHYIDRKKDLKYESYNGAVLDNYTWSQTIADVDLRIPVPNDVKSSKMVLVELHHRHLKVSIKQLDNWKSLVDGDFSWKINLDNSLWTLVPGEHIHINLGKCEERWWTSVLVDDPKIDVTTINSEMPIEDIDEEDQAKIEEMMYNQMQKQMGKPTTEEKNVHELMKEAWNKPGSPFAGQAYDPSLYYFGNDNNFPPGT
ncbi:hypothetical protein CHUAL_013204 [Chamberlinius hualienensis]